MATMNKPIALADALDEAARRIETGEADYCWTSLASCNCGILAQVVTGMDRKQLSDAVHKNLGAQCWGMWKDVAQSKCAITGMRKGTILRALADVGLNFSDIVDLESLLNPEILNEAGIDAPLGFRVNPEYVARYMRAWATLIRRSHEQQKSVPAADVVMSSHPLSPAVDADSGK